MKADTQSSMEYHLKKREMYWIESGQLKLGIRRDRAINDIVLLNEGECFEIPPGMMHCRMAVTDCVIIEACSFDSPEDTFIVHDGHTYKHEEGPQ